MTGRERKSISLRQLAGPVACVAASGALLLLAYAASAQQPLQPQDPQSGAALQPTNPPTVQPPSTASPPGALEQVGRWIDDSVSTAGVGIGKAFQGTIGGFGGIGGQAGTAAQGAADAATSVAKGVAQGAADVATAAARLPSSRIASGREKCTFAPNGAPDCRGAADALCKSRGFQSGTCIEFENAENCPANVLIAGRERTEGDCPVDYFVTKSLCQ
jgi:hypothetical protein